ncbi:MAG TPA: methyltransferase domain-containing protein [Polyangiaceae bacterium]|nr:methyltransferase domain-containing protein [Polyangiaceae bacterium]
MSSDAQFWNRQAESYSRKPVSDPVAFERKISVIQSLIQPHSVIADLGCGTGSLALRLAPFAREVYGLDVSQEMIRIARDKTAVQGVSNVTFAVGKVDESVPYTPQSLDGICVCSLLHLVEHRPSVLALAFKLLKPGGFLVSSTPCLAESSVPYRPLLKLLHWLGRAPKVQVMSKLDLASEIRAAGFSELEQPDVGAKPMIAFMTAVKPH